MLASQYAEIVVERVYAGKVQLTTALQPSIEATEKVLEIDQSPQKRGRTLIRVDAGGGSLDDVNWLLQRGYLILTKDYSSKRARQFAESVTQWVDDPTHPGRQVGLVARCRRLSIASQLCALPYAVAKIMVSGALVS